MANTSALGAFGTILYYNGASWSSMSSGTTNDLYGVWGSSSSDVFAVGEGGTILHATPSAPAQAGTCTLSIDVGSIHFAGEKAEFHALSTYNGAPVDATITLANLYGPGGTLTADLTGAVTSVTTGLFRIPWDIPTAVPPGTYTLLMGTKYCYDAYWGLWINMAEIKSFVVSSTLTQWNAWLTDIKDDIATIQTDIGTIKGKVEVIEEDVATVKTDVGTIKAKLAEWCGGAISSIITPSGATRYVIVLTTSDLAGPVTVSGDALSIAVAGEPGTQGKLNIWTSKALLAELDSGIDKIDVTLDGNIIPFSYIEYADAYSVSILYPHSTHRIDVYLTGQPHGLAAYWWLVIGVAVVAAGAATWLVIRRHRKTENARE